MSLLPKPIKKILIIGSGPIVIGQAAEFDYSGTQACVAAREEGIKTILVNSNPATIQTDPEIADKIYIEPLNCTILEKIIAIERPDGILAGAGGQTGLNLGVQLYEEGILKKYGVQFLGSSYETIETGEDRGLFKAKMEEIGEPVLKAKSCTTVEDGLEFAHEIGFPVILRVAFTLGGTGGNTAFDEKDLETKLKFALECSPVGSCLLERSIIGWGEYEYEMIRDHQGNKIVICNMENIDPMGVHTGESIVTAPAQTLSDQDHQKLRNSALKIVEELDIRGGCNVQFAFNRNTLEYYVIEVNPRLSRSSALASKATGYPIAKVATKIALGKTLPEIINGITGKTAFFEPSLDYIVIKIPRWPDDKYPEMDRTLGVTMKSTGEIMAIGRNFGEAMYKAIMSLDLNYCTIQNFSDNLDEVKQNIKVGNTRRLKNIFNGFELGLSSDEVTKLSSIHPWFTYRLYKFYQKFKAGGFGYFNSGNIDFKMVDTCAGEFESYTPFFYSTKKIGEHEIIQEDAEFENFNKIEYNESLDQLGNEAQNYLYNFHEKNYDYLIDKAKRDGRELVIDALVFNDEGKVFIQKRRSNRKFLPQCWGVVGGHFYKKSNFDEDLICESIFERMGQIVKDETNWNLKKIKNVVQIRDWESRGVRKRTVAFEVEVSGDINAPKLELDKVNGYLWVSDADLVDFEINKGFNESLMVNIAKKGLEIHNEPKKVIILGSGPIRIGQGVEFDYLTVHAVRALQKKGIKAIIINNNPETVSTDYSTSDRLYFEPLTPDFVANIIENEKNGLVGVIPQFGGQTAIKLARPLEELNYQVLGTSADAIDLAEDRELTGKLMDKLGYKMPQYEVSKNKNDIFEKASKISYPVLIRPSFVLGGDGMKIVYSDDEVQTYLDVNFPKTAVDFVFPKPLYIDKFLDNAIEVDIDFITDTKKTYCFVLEQLDKAGIHSGDSASVFPAQNLSRDTLDQLVEMTRNIAKEFKVIGIGNLQCAIKDGEIYIIEVNPRASRTVPFVSKCLGFSLAELATNVIMGDELPEFDFDLEYYKNPEYARTLVQNEPNEELPIQHIAPKFVAIKWPVFCIEKLTGVNPELGPLMKSTGETMTVGKTFAEALAKHGTEDQMIDCEVISL